VRAGVGWNAEDQKLGMTFDELLEIVEQAKKVGLPGGARVKVKVGWSGQTQQLRIEEAQQR
jgi:hypothetical protein